MRVCPVFALQVGFLIKLCIYFAKFAKTGVKTDETKTTKYS